MRMSELELLTNLLWFVLGYTTFGISILALFRIKFFEIRFLFLSFLIGQTIFYLYCLSTLPLSFAKYLPIIGLIYLIYTLLYRKVKISFKNVKFLQIVEIIVITSVFFYMTTPYIKSIILDPIYQWDARCGWYYHAKQIYLSNGINKSTGFLLRNEFNDISHPHYPKYTNCLAAYFANSVGFWNEYIPKTNLYVHLIGVLFALVSLTKLNIIVRLGFCFVAFTYNSFWINSGYMDIWIGIYLGLGLLNLVNYLQTKERLNLVTFLYSMLFLLNIKREGMMINASFFLSFFFIFFIIFFNTKTMRHFLFTINKYIPILLLAILPFVVWTIIKRIWGFISFSDFEFSKVFDVEHFKTQFYSWRFDYAYKGFITNIDIEKSFFTVLLVGFVSTLYLLLVKANKLKIQNYLSGFVIIIVAFIIYMTTIVLSYVVAMAPDQDMKFYVDSSNMRIFSSYFMFLIVGFFSIILSFFDKSLLIHRLKNIEIVKKKNINIKK